MEEKDAGQAEHLTLNQENVRCYVGVGASAGVWRHYRNYFSICRRTPAHLLLLYSIFRRTQSA
ncbi:hypothetical protein LC724_22650 [Blautia sp. RD014234]|nr:hypothetical protein [Blautia parvula]